MCSCVLPYITVFISIEDINCVHLCTLNVLLFCIHLKLHILYALLQLLLLGLAFPVSTVIQTQHKVSVVCWHV